ncbi:MAG: hypothetical protein AB7J13_10980 [Pyrinomonadaceae bacterium]
MPGPFKIDQFSQVLPTYPDLFICCASFEDRCKTIPLLITPQNIKRAIICNHNEVIEYTKNNLDELCHHYGTAGQKVGFSIDDPLLTVDALLPVLEEANFQSNLNIALDITTFTRESLLIVVRLLVHFLAKGSKLLLLYNDADDYSIGLNLPDKWLSKGINEVRSVLGYPGFSSPLNKNHLIVMSGFKDERTAKLIEEFEASVVSIGVADEDTTDLNFHEGNFSYFQKVCTNIQNIDEFKFSLSDPQETRKALLRQIAKHPEHDVTIAPMNNKISTLGAAFVAIENPDIQLCYAQADYYNFDAYSAPGPNFFYFEIPELGNSGKLI